MHSLVLECPPAARDDLIRRLWGAATAGIVEGDWNREPTPPGRLRLEVNPGLAGGTERHLCTQMCLEAMERWVRPGDSLLDVGVGSGILSVAARLLGARYVAGCDIDAEALAVASETRAAGLFAGSADAVRSRSLDVAAPVVEQIERDGWLCLVR